MTIRWISYTQQNIPGNQSFKLGLHSSLREAVEDFREFREGVGTDECSMTLYVVPRNRTRSDMPSGDEMISTAKEFEGVGCPFDYPDRLITTGIRGGVKIERA
jgi:hypothetical protein